MSTLNILYWLRFGTLSIFIIIDWPQPHGRSVEKPASIGEEEAKTRLGRSRSRLRFGMLSIFIIMGWPQVHEHSVEESSG
jgi:hypothetical protein